MNSIPENQPLAKAISAVAKELGLTLTSSADTKNASLAITASSASKLTKCLGPKGVLVACSGTASGASLSVSATDAIFNGIGIKGFELGMYLL